MLKPPLNDPRRHRRGNRTVRMSAAMWKAVLKNINWPHDDAYLKARSFCRATEVLPNYGSQEKVTTVELIRRMIHDSSWQSTPSQQRKRFGPAIRILLQRIKEDRLMRKGRAQPGQMFTQIPTATFNNLHGESTPPESWKDWKCRFKPVPNHLSKDGAWGGLLFEPMGPGYFVVQAAAPGTVWTLLDVQGQLVVTDGWSFVNRIGYFITEVPCPSSAEFDASEL